MVFFIKFDEETIEMKNKSLFIFTIFQFILLQLCIAQGNKPTEITYFNTVPKTQIRALEVLNDSVVWFAAYYGIWGYTENGGKTWHIDSIKNKNSELNFRSMAVLNDSTILMMSIASPAYIYKTSDKGKHWKIVYENKDSLAFLDCIKFLNNKIGYALGDPIGNDFTLLKTEDGGNTWSKLDSKNLPTLDPGEAFFATSNTNMEVFNNEIYIASGGKTSRLWVYDTKNNKAYYKKTPLPSGEQMTGIFSMDFYSKKLGVIGGGHYDQKDKYYTSLAITEDAGDSWKSLSFNKPMFSSCVQFLNADELISTGHSGTVIINIKNIEYKYITNKENQELYFHCLKISPSKKYLWLAGRNGKVACIKTSEL